ncbi:OprD family outer membrane porin [Sulfurovum sp. XGS-02]|uniref:OprD family outer membrane porin n=1 Tax=Sulfurovum sp. XGS-02 TaxID=2925411 RepID=UPI00205B35E2|nr:OprD family outer membrane porin [Sulfurovum sp. XGS-02]UPT77505.1 OprD family outer membrane porin [Sulfurovum sp. XGS-02]
MITGMPLCAESLGQSLSKAHYDAMVRVGYQSHKADNDTDTEYALGVKLHFETAPFYGLQAGATLFTSQGNGEEGFEGIPFFDEKNEDYAILGEAYLKGRFSGTTLVAGRQSFDTPFADSDDIGMVPNTFEALTLLNTSLKDTTIFLSHLQKWAGVDSESPGTFSNVHGNEGMQIVGITYEGMSKTVVSGWFYYLKDAVKISYLEANYEEETDRFTYGGALQYAFQDYDNAEDSEIYGVAASFGLKKAGLTATIAYNKVHGSAADNFFGGGPFFTNAEHNTLREEGPDGETILYTIGWDASIIGAEGLNFTANIDAHTGEQNHAREYDIGMGYAYSDAVNFSAVYSDVENGDLSFQNFRMFVNYSF